jgi:hypothetical protein
MSIIVAIMPPRKAIDYPAARTPRNRRRLVVAAMKTQSGIAEASSKKEPHLMDPPLAATKATALLAESRGM